MLLTDNSKARLIIVFFSLAYFCAFDVTVPHGDALRIVRQIESQELIWNPNHLLLDPFGYAWYFVLRSFGISISVLGSFEAISAISTLVSLLLFDEILRVLGVKRYGLRLISVFGLFASKNFLSMAVSQYFFMMQMPFLLGALYFLCTCNWQRPQKTGDAARLYATGAFLAFAAAIEFNNVMLIVVLGVIIAYCTSIRHSLGFWAVAALVGFPLFIGGYLLAEKDVGLFAWVLSYQGDVGSTLDNYWGTRWDIEGVAVSLARVMFNLFVGNIVETSGAGTFLRVIAFGEPLEFVPSWGRLALAGVLAPLSAAAVFSLGIWSIMQARKSKLIAVLLGWIIAYLAFNFLWSGGADLFWFQTLPVFWLLLVLGLGWSHRYPELLHTKRWKWFGERPWIIIGVSGGLLVLNTLQTVIPIAWADLDRLGQAYRKIVADAELVIVPGWDGLKWMSHSDSSVGTERLILMSMALKTSQSDDHITRLPKIIEETLAENKKVVVGRLYEPDRTINPWYGLAEAGWPRDKILTLLSPFCSTEVGRVDDVVFHELHRCDKYRL